MITLLCCLGRTIRLLLQPGLVQASCRLKHQEDTVGTFSREKEKSNVITKINTKNSRVLFIKIAKPMYNWCPRLSQVRIHFHWKQIENGKGGGVSTFQFQCLDYIYLCEEQRTCNLFFFGLQFWWLWHTHTHQKKWRLILLYTEFSTWEGSKNLIKRVQMF